MHFIVFIKQAPGTVVACLKSSINMSRALTSAVRTMQATERICREVQHWRGDGEVRLGGCKQWETDSTSCFSFSIVSFPT